MTQLDQESDYIHSIDPTTGEEDHSPRQFEMPTRDADNRPCVVKGTIAEIKELLRTNMLFFILSFIPDLTLRPPQFHLDILNTVTNPNITRLCIVAFRGSSKTMLLRLAMLHSILFDDTRFGMFINEAASNAVDSAKVVMRYLRSKLVQDLFGEVEMLVDRENKGEFEFLFQGKHISLYARGTDSAVLGKNVDNDRPDFILCDDLESYENLQTATFYDRISRWFFGTMAKLVNPFKNKIVYIGNMNNKRSVLASLTEDPEWYSIVLSALKDDGTSLWEEMFPRERLLAEFNQYCRHGMQAMWLSQMMSRADVEGSGVISAKDITFHNGINPDDVTKCCITIDPAISDKETADEAVITVHGWYGNRWNMCRQVAGTGIDAMSLINRALDLAIEWRCPIIAVETVAYQQALLPLFESQLLVRKLQSSIRVRGMQSRAAKNSRILSWYAMLRSGSYTIPSNDPFLLSQILRFDPSTKKNKDDRIDCGSMILMALALFPNLMNTYLYGDQDQALADLPPILTSADLEIQSDLRRRFGTTETARLPVWRRSGVN